MCSIGIGGGGGVKTSPRALLLALLATVGALAALTLSAGAQTPGGEPDPGESGSTETAQGRIIARVQDRTGEDGVDDYRIEFGFFPEWALDEAESWPEAIASRSGWLPSSRFLTKSRIDARAAADNRGWLRSSLISVPAQSAQAPGGDQTQITGRVVARYNPDSDGRLRDRFGFGDLRLEFLFVPQWAFTGASSTAEAVARLSADNLPRARYLSVATIDARRDIWLRSSVVNVPLRAPVVVIEQPQAPVIDGVSCAPSSPTVNESVTCTATLSGGAPDSYAWSGGASSGSSATYTTSFSSAGSKPVSLTATNSAGSDSASTTVSVGSASANNPPNCPGAARQHLTDDMSISFTERYASLCTDPDGDALTWSLSSRDTSVVRVSESGDDWTIQAVADGLARIDVTATDPGGSSTRTSIEVLVVDPPRIAAVNCAPTRPVVGERVTCSATLADGTAPDTTRWTGGTSTDGSGLTYTTSFDAAGDHLIYFDVSYLWIGSQRETAITVVEGSLQPPVIDAVNCSPSSPSATETVVCSATLSGGGPESWAWRTANGSGSGVNHSTSFSKAGDYAVSLTVTNAAGSDSDSITLTVGALSAPVIDAINCSPSPPSVGDDITCTADLSGGAPESYAWQTGDRRGSRAAYSTSFDTAGSQTISLTVTNSAGSDTDSITLTVAAAVQAPVIDSISCSPSSPTVDESVTCTATLSGGAPTSYAWSGGADAGSSATYSTSFSSAGSKTVSLTVTNAAGSDADSVTVTVPVQAPVIDSISCSPSSPTVDESVTCTATLSGGAPASYAWSGGADAGSSAAYSTSFSSTGSKTVSLTVTNAAGSDSESITLTVGAAVQAPVIDSISCSPSSPTVDESVTCTATLSGGVPASYAWSGGADAGSSAAYSTSFSSAGSKTVSLTVTNSVGSDTDSISLTAFDAVQAPVIDSISCSPASPKVAESVTCTATLSGGAPASLVWNGGVPGVWRSGDVTIGAVLSGSKATYHTSFISAGSKTVSLTVTNAAGSDTDSISLTASDTVRPPVIASIGCSTASPIVDQPVTCAVTFISGLLHSWYSYAWSGGGEAGSSDAYHTSFSSTGPKTVSVTVTNAAGSATDSVALTVVAAAQAPVVDSITCTPSSPTVDQTVTCTVTLSGGDYTSRSWNSTPSFYAGNNDGGSFTFLFSNPGSYTISMTASNAVGSDTGSTTITVAASQPAESLQAPVIDAINCTAHPLGRGFNCTPNLSGGAPTTYDWNGRGPVPEESRLSVWFPAVPGDRTISLTVANAVGSDTHSVTVTVVVQPVIDSISCSPSSPTVDESVTCTATLSGGAPTSYAWSGGADAGSSGTYSTSFSSAGSKTVSLTVTNSVGSDSDSVTLTVVAATGSTPVVDSISCSPASPTVDQSVSCTATLSGGAPTSYAWSGGASSGSSATYSTSFSSTGSKTVSVTVTNAAGSDSGTTTVTVAAAAVQAPVVDSVSCSPASPKEAESVTCTATLSGGAPTSYSWSGGTSSGSSAAYNTSLTGSTAVSLTVTNVAGSDTDSIIVNIAAQEAPVIDSISCSPSSPTVNQSVTCTATLSGGAPNAYPNPYFWSGGPVNSSLATYNTSFSSSGSKTVSLTVTNSAGSDTDSVTVTVVAVTVSAPVVDSVSCSPASPTVDQSVSCTATLSGGAPATYAWSGGSSSGSSAAYSTSFSSAGSKTISLTVTNAGGSNSGSTTVTVAAAVQAPVVDSISCSPASPKVSESVSCTATLSGGTPASYAWSGGASSGSSATYSTSFSSSGSKTVSLTVTNAGGSNSGSTTVTVAVPAPVIDSISCSPSSPTVNQSVTCTAPLSGGYPTSHAWSGGTSSGSTIAHNTRSGDTAVYNTSFSSSGSKTVSLTVTNSAGSDTDSVTVTVAVPAPVVDSVSCSPASPTVNQSVSCTATLSGGTPASYSWSGGASSGSSATYSTSFSSSGSKTVSLTVTNSAGSDTDSVTVTVSEEAPVIDSVSCSPASPKAADTVTCTATLSGGAPASYSWSGGALSGSSATYSTGFGSAGSKTVSLTVTNAGGSDTDSVTVTVSEEAPVIASVSCTPASPTVGQAVTCRAILSHGYNASFAWSGSAPSAWSGGTYVTSYSSAGSKTISVTATNATGSDSDSVTVTVVAAE